MFVEVFVGSSTYHQDSPLTYSSPFKLEPGQIVAVPLQKKRVLGIVAKIVGRPSFAAKDILEIPELPPLPAQYVALLEWMRSYYPGPLGITTQLFLPDSLPNGLPAITDAKSNPELESLPKLTQDQKQALANIGPSGLHILHGETGTGKTRVYQELAVQNFKLGRSSIIMTPEIGLTSQLANNFKMIFGNRVVTMHSGLTDTVRNQNWQTLLCQQQPVVVVGARSALFSPLKNIGLIVVDEAHETSYKQDQTPYYHASTVAAKLASLHKAVLVLGSATPLVTDSFIAQAKGRPIIRMTQIAAGSVNASSDTQVIDLKDRSRFGKSSYLSTPLLEAIADNLKNRKQILLFLNRRGTARVVFCEKCGWQAHCPHCDLPLVYHDDNHLIRCHSCSFKTQPPTSCPECKSTDVVFKSIGTKAIASEAKRLFPEAKVMRFDTDNKKTERLEAHYDSLRSGEVDILIGTQTLAKGLDLPRLGLVGVVLADTGLYFPDFSAQERTYQLLAQVLGRVGRGHTSGSAIIQTYSPNSPMIRSVLGKDWGVFYNTELKERQQFSFPPFCYLLKISCRRASNNSAQKAAETLADKLSSEYNNRITIEGPAPAFHQKIRNKFVWQLIIKTKRREYLTSIIKKLPSGWSHDIDPMNLL